MADAIYHLATMENPPIRLPLGSDTVAVINKKAHFLLSETEHLRELALSTDFSK